MRDKKTVTYKLCMNVTESCGHRAPEFWEDMIDTCFATKGFAEDNDHCIDWGSLCPECYAWNRKFGLLLDKEEEERWMMGELPYTLCPFCKEEIELDYEEEWCWECKSCGCSENEGTLTITNPWGEDEG